MDSTVFNRLVVLEMANNHMGDVEHGLKVIRDFHEAVKGFNFRFAIKFQYRDLDTLIHPDYQGRMDIKYIKRFSETRLSGDDFLKMKEEAEKLGFVTMCTPFDEKSVDLVEKHGYQIIKIASCSFTDWPLWERIVKTDKPLIASTAGASLDEIDNIVTFLEHRNKTFCLMHCVGSYPTPDSELEMNQIDFFKQRYPGVPVGFSTHEAPDNTVPAAIAVAKGAVVLERHVGVAAGNYQLNAYSSSPAQVVAWLKAAEAAYAMCGVSGRRREISTKEREDLRGLQRGVFAKDEIAAGEKIAADRMFYAIPNEPAQLLANDISKYKVFTALSPVKAGGAVMTGNLKIANNREKVLAIVKELCKLIKDSGIRLQDKLELELSHHYGIDRFHEKGCAIITCVNREYCKKIILLLGGQLNPTHAHKIKEETFHVLYGDVELELDGVQKTYSAGDIIVVERNKKHNFASEHGAVLEEISTTHHKGDSYYDDPEISEPNERKTYMTFHADWLTERLS